MKIGIIIYSLSHHTLSVARRLAEQFSAFGHEVALEQIEIEGPAVPNNEKAELKTIPTTAPYEAIVFGSPVRGGVLPSPVRRYCEQIESLEGKRAACLVTGFFPEGWGRERVLSQMREILNEKGAQVCGTASVGWLSFEREQQIRKVVEDLVRCFEA